MRRDWVLIGLRAMCVIGFLVLVITLGVDAYRQLFPYVPTYTVCVQVDQNGHVLPGECSVAH